MAEISKWDNGTFCWVDLGTTDIAGAKTFYSELFGWEAKDDPITGADGPAMDYTAFYVRGKDVAGAYPQTGEQRSQGIPPAWTSYINVDDVDTVVKNVTPLGGQVLMEPADVMDHGRVALLADPTGAVVGLWQPKANIGARLVNEPGSISWNELLTSDIDAAKKFYGELLGWTADDTDMGDGYIYTVANNGEKPVAGMMPIQEDMGPIPSNWGVYFEVEDCDATASQARELGGAIEVEPRDIPEVGRFALMKDPQGAYFSVIKSEQPPA